MSDTQVSLVGSGSRQVEQESSEETTLTQVSKDLGHTKMSEKSAQFEATSNTSIVEENASKNVQSSCSVLQSESVSQSVSENRKDTEDSVAPTAQSDEKVETTSEPKNNYYKPLEPIKSFEPVKPFEPLQPFEPLKPFEPPKSFELTKQAEKIVLEAQEAAVEIVENQLNHNNEIKETKLTNGNVETTKSSLYEETKVEEENIVNNGFPPDYVPVEALPPFVLPPTPEPQEPIYTQPKAEIKEERIKNSLKEIISDLDSYAEKDKELKESYYEEKKVDGNSTTYSYESQSQSQVREIMQELSGGQRFQDENAPPPKPINLEKIFTPADGEQIQPSKNRKMYASSAFYAKGIHPTVEEQVQLAKRISSSLSDISNQTSKGQSMYVNRKKRSVKWVHEGDGLTSSENLTEYSETSESKDPLKLVMNPHGQIQDIYSLRRQGHTIEPALSPDVCLEIVKDLNSPKGKGAELFAKRRKRSEKWVVGETNGTRPSSIPDIAPSPTPLLSPLPPISSFPPPSYLPETAQRIQHKEKLDEIQEKFTRPRVKLVKSPWDAALETGSVDAAFQEMGPVWPTRGNYVAPVVDSYEAALKSDTLPSWSGAKFDDSQKVYAHNPAYNSNSINRIVDNLQKGVGNVDLYKPAMPQAWNATLASAPKQQQYSSNTLPRSKPKPPLSPNYKPNVAPQVFVPKESNSPLPSLNTPAYNAQSVLDPPQPPPRVNFNSMQNYNTAPRGWGQSQNYYKPITFDKPTSSYSDF